MQSPLFLPSWLRVQDLNPATTLFENFLLTEGSRSRPCRGILLLCLLLLTVIALPGCREKPADEAAEAEGPKVSEELKEAGEHLKKAGEIVEENVKETATEFGDLLNEEWHEAQEAAFEKKEALNAAYQRNLDKAKSRRDAWAENLREDSREAHDRLSDRIARAEQRLADLREATAENWDAARRAFNVAWEELRDAFRKAKAEFTTRPGEPAE